jgi:hypothetical protein
VVTSQTIESDDWVVGTPWELLDPYKNNCDNCAYDYEMGTCCRILSNNRSVNDWIHKHFNHDNCPICPGYQPKSTKKIRK